MQVLKAVAAAAAAGALWLTLNFGWALWILLGLVAVDLLLNRTNEGPVWQKLQVYLVSAAATAFLGAHVGGGVAFVHVLIVGLAGFELIRVTEEIQPLVMTAIAHERNSRITPAQAASELAALRSQVQRLIDSQPARAQTPNAGAPAAPGPGGA